MRCTEARELLLTAEPDELRGEGDSTLAGHLRTCPACRRLATAILESEAALAADLDALAAGRSADVTGALLRSIEAAGLGRSRKRRPLLIPFLLPLAAAALLAVLLLPSRSHRDSREELALPAAFASAEAPALSTPPGRTALILDTDDPDYQIIWFF